MRKKRKSEKKKNAHRWRWRPSSFFFIGITLAVAGTASSRAVLANEYTHTRKLHARNRFPIAFRFRKKFESFTINTFRTHSHEYQLECELGAACVFVCVCVSVGCWANAITLHSPHTQPDKVHTYLVMCAATYCILAEQCMRYVWRRVCCTSHQSITINIDIPLTGTRNAPHNGLLAININEL